MTKTRTLIRVKPGSSSEQVREMESGTLAVEVKARPEKGQANRAAIKLLAKHFGVTQAQVRIVAGHKTRNKLIEISS